MRKGTWLFVATVTVAACGNAANGPCTLTAVGYQCANDTDCCTGYCKLVVDRSAGFCQDKPATPEACVDANGFCTQDRNCCSGLCENGSCFAGSGGGSCLAIGSSCIQPDSCCSNDCLDDGLGHTACATRPQSDAGVSCGLPGVACSHPDQSDPTECCFGICNTFSVCGGGGAGDGGSNCGQSGTQCRYGSDCCTGQCEKLSSGSACH